MSNTRLSLQGMAEFRAALRQLPEDLAQEAGVIVQAQAEFAKDQIQRAYPHGPTGNLQSRVTATKESESRFGARSIVRSRAPHASIFEFGSKARRTNTGANRGRMPKAPASEAMIPIVVRRRRAMVSALIDLVRKAGFVVEGV